MQINNLIKNKLLQYLSNEISKEDLYRWALDVLHSMLRGDIFKIAYLMVWGIISELTTINDIDNVYCEELAHQFSRVLSGNESASFIFAFRIPERFVLKDLLRIKNILHKYLQKECLSKSEILELKIVANQKSDGFNTLNELLKVQIIDLINLGYEFHDDKGNVEFGLKSTVFIDENASSLLEKDLLEKIITLLECYNGEKSFYIHTTFSDGVGSISIQV